MAPIPINGAGVYATRGGHLVFIRHFETGYEGMKAYGYSITGRRSDANAEWRAWHLDGRIYSGGGAEWDIVEAA